MRREQKQRLEKLKDELLLEGSQQPLPRSPAQFSREVLKFNPLPYQEKLLEDNADRIAVLFCRQSGKSTTLAAKGVIYACQHPDSTVLIVAPGLRQSMLLMDKIHEHIGRVEPEVKHALVHSMQRTIVRLRNGSKIIALPCAENLIRGITANSILADEAAFFEQDEYVFNNVLMPMLATTKGSLIVSSTPWSRKSMFYEICKGKLSSRFSQHYATWRDAVEASLISKQFIDDMMTSLLPQQFTMEFEAEFVEDVDAWLPQDLLASCVDAELQPYGFESHPMGSFYIGMDLGKHQDHSVVAAVERKEEKLNLVHVHRFPLETAYASIIGYVKALCDRWRSVQAIYVDATGNEYIVEDMVRSGILNVKGVKFTVESKENMASVLKDRMSRSFRMPYDREVINELNVERYELMKTGHIQFSHPSGTKDDRFWAIALAVLAASQAPGTEPAFIFG